MRFGEYNRPQHTYKDADGDDVFVPAVVAQPAEALPGMVRTCGVKWGTCVVVARWCGVCVG